MTHQAALEAQTQTLILHGEGQRVARTERKWKRYVRFSWSTNSNPLRIERVLIALLVPEV